MCPPTMKISNNKAIFTGNYRQFYTYEKPFTFGFKNNKKNASLVTTDMSENSEERREKYVQTATSRAKNQIKRLIHGNQYEHQEKPVFLTLTFKENITNVKTANREFNMFIKRMNRRIKKLLRYVAVHEYQKRGALHYHMIIFNLPFLEHKEIAKIWRNGMIDIELVNYDGLPNYMTKYISKSFKDLRMKGTKRYFYSLHNPVRLERDNSRCIFEHTKMNQKDLIKVPKTYRYVDYTGNGNSVTLSEYFIGGAHPVAKQGCEHPTQT